MANSFFVRTINDGTIARGSQI